MAINHVYISLISLVFVLALPVRTIGQEICDDGIDNDGDFLIDCFDPDCCEDCADHYFFDCDTACTALQLKDSLVLNTLWRQNMGWNGLSTPLVGKMENGQSRIIGLSNTAFSPFSTRDLTVIDGNSGDIVRQIPTAAMSQYAQTAVVGDVNNDGVGEIIAALSDEAINDRRLICYTVDGIILWDTNERYGYSDAEVSMSPSLADFNEDGLAEVYIGNQIFNASANGDLLCQGGAANNRGLQVAQAAQYRMYSVVAADILPDNACTDCSGLELAAGNQVYSVDIASGRMEVVRENNAMNFGDGLTAVADMNNDFSLDLVVARRVGDFVHIWVWSPIDDQILAHYIHNSVAPSSFSGGSCVPLLTDLDEDGLVDIVFATSMELVALRNEAASFRSLWIKETADLSGRAGVVSFDFDGNGRPELVHSDGTHLRLMDGATGRTLDSVGCFSPTFYEKPIIANIDDDPAAEILCSCDGSLLALTSGFSQWASARPVWNQVNFYNTHIKDDLSLPTVQQDPAYPELNGRRPLNRFNEQYSQPDQPTADLVYENVTINCMNGRRWMDLEFCNPGDVRVPAGFSLRVFSSDPTESILQADTIYNITDPLGIDDCNSYQFPLPQSFRPDTAYLVINALAENLPLDTIAEEGFVTLECRYDNNLLALDLTPYNNAAFDLGPDTLICGSEMISLKADIDNPYRYSWSDGSVQDSLVVSASGIYSLTLTDQCGNVLIDSIEVSSVDLPDIGLPLQISICAGDTIGYEADLMPYDSLIWYFDDERVCQNCSVWESPILDTGVLVIQAYVGRCSTSDTAIVVPQQVPMSRDSVFICPGEQYNWNGNPIGAGTYVEEFDINAVCDSIAVLVVGLLDAPDYEIQLDPLCEGDSTTSIEVVPDMPGQQILWADGSTSFIRQNVEVGTYPFVISSTDGCSIEDTVYLEPLSSPLTEVLVLGGGCRNEGRSSVMVTTSEPAAQIFWNGSFLDSMQASIANVEPGNYSLQIQFGDCRFDSSIVVPSNAQDSIYMDERITVTRGDTIVIGEEFGGTLQEVNWTGPGNCLTCMPQVLSPIGDQQWILNAIDRDSCPVLKRYIISVEAYEAIYIPNVFTPNSDGINDILTLYAREEGIVAQTFQIFDRWGNLVLEQNALEGPEMPVWDGTTNGVDMSEGVYIYRLEFSNSSGERQIVLGSVTLVR